MDYYILASFCVLVPVFVVAITYFTLKDTKYEDLEVMSDQYYYNPKKND